VGNPKEFPVVLMGSAFAVRDSEDAPVDVFAVSQLEPVGVFPAHVFRDYPTRDEKESWGTHWLREPDENIDQIGIALCFVLFAHVPLQTLFVAVPNAGAAEWGSRGLDLDFISDLPFRWRDEDIDALGVVDGEGGDGIAAGEFGQDVILAGNAGLNGVFSHGLLSKCQFG
jgi:hypothetical protein